VSTDRRRRRRRPHPKREPLASPLADADPGHPTVREPPAAPQSSAASCSSLSPPTASASHPVASPHSPSPAPSAAPAPSASPSASQSAAGPHGQTAAPRNRNRTRNRNRARHASSASVDANDQAVGEAAPPPHAPPPHPSARRQGRHGISSESSRSEPAANPIRRPHTAHGAHDAADAQPHPSSKGVKQLPLTPSRSRSHAAPLSFPSSNSMPVGAMSELALTVVSDSSINQRALLERQLRENSVECSICSDLIKRDAHIWNCAQCSHMFHRRCIERWCRSKRNGRAAAAASDDANVAWECPACVFVYTGPPAEYACFCAKVVLPDFNPFVLPHSCGAICDRPRSHADSGCLHRCTSLCHPGRCDPCTAMGEVRSCSCGAMKYQLRCGEIEKVRRTCDSGVCKSRLACGCICNLKCHSTPCPESCGKLVSQRCFCGSHSSERLCGSGQRVSSDGVSTEHYCCNNPCMKVLDCQEHFCSSVCHAGPCAPCALKPQDPQPCACGKTSMSLAEASNAPPAIRSVWVRSSCVDPLPLCTSDPCGKLLSCQAHRCREPCHAGACPPCTSTIRRQCRCGRELLSLPCEAVRDPITGIILNGDALIAAFTCDRICGQKLACGNQHSCGERCCSKCKTQIQLCSRVCKKTLDCGVHNCDNFCSAHRNGICPPCSVVYRDGIVCDCGATRSPPFTTCGSIIKPCNRPCTKPRPCGHRCTYTCHVGDCPPCATLMKKVCGGGHKELANIPCFAIAPSCGVPCRRLLPCGTHNCNRPCHSGPCITKSAAPSIANPSPWGSRSDQPASKNVDLPAGDDGAVFPCNQRCSNARSVCGHPCRSPCHVGLTCPDNACQESITVSCECRRLSKVVKCGAALYKLEQFKQSIQVDSGSSHGQPDDYWFGRSLPCNEDCLLEKRNAALRDALGVHSSSIGDSASPSSILYPRELIQAIVDKSLADVVLKYERVFADWLAPRGSLANSNTKTLPPMSKDHRWLIHQMAAFYNVTTESFDQEPRRTVRLSRRSNSAIPPTLLSGAVKTHRVASAQPSVKSAHSNSTVDNCSILYFFDLDHPPVIRAADLRLCLRDWELSCRINWLDDNRALCSFLSASAMAEARSFLERKNLFSFHPDSSASELAHRHAHQFQSNGLYRRSQHSNAIQPRPLGESASSRIRASAPRSLPTAAISAWDEANWELPPEDSSSSSHRLTVESSSSTSPPVITATSSINTVASAAKAHGRRSPSISVGNTWTLLDSEADSDSEAESNSDSTRLSRRPAAGSAVDDWASDAQLSKQTLSDTPSDSKSSDDDW